MTGSSETTTPSPGMSLRDLAGQNPVYLISADLPGCGASTLSEGIEARLQEDGYDKPHVLSIGQILRKKLGVSNEAEMAAKLKEINDPHSFDPDFYGNLPSDRPCIIEGKLATTVGPQYIDGRTRPVIKLDLTSTPLVSAKRVTQREGRGRFSEIFHTQRGGQELLGKLAMIKARALHDLELRKEMDQGCRYVQCTPRRFVPHSLT